MNKINKIGIIVAIVLVVVSIGFITADVGDDNLGDDIYLDYSGSPGNVVTGDTFDVYAIGDAENYYDVYGDYVIFTVTDPNGNARSSGHVPFYNKDYVIDVASFAGIRANIEGNYTLSAIVYDLDDNLLVTPDSIKIPVKNRTFDDFNLSYSPSNVVKGDNISVNAITTDEAKIGPFEEDWAQFIVTLPNGSLMDPKEPFNNKEGDVYLSTLQIPNATIGNYTVYAIATDYSGKVLGITDNITISVENRTYNLVLNGTTSVVEDDTIIVNATASNATGSTDYVNFTVTDDDNGIVIPYGYVSFVDGVATLNIPNAAIGNYTVNAIAYDGDDVEITGATAIPLGITVDERAYYLVLNGPPTHVFENDTIIVNANASTDTGDDDYVIFNVTDPDGTATSSDPVLFDGRVASLNIPNAIKGNYTVTAVAYDGDDDDPIINATATPFPFIITVYEKAYDLTLTGPLTAVKGDTITVNATANITPDDGDYVIFNVTAPNGTATFSDHVLFDGSVASLNIHATTGTYIVTAVGYDGDNDNPIANAAQPFTITVDERAYDLVLNGTTSVVEGDTIIVNATASTDPGDGNYVIFSVTGPDGVNTPYNGSFAGRVAILNIPNATTGTYTVTAGAYDGDDPIYNSNTGPFTITVNERAYDLVLNGTTSVVEGDTIIVNATASTDPGGDDYVIFNVIGPDGVNTPYNR
ncbi:MAG: hypothetical protein LBT66_02605, partial [Methanobrevibacter sp.]|nr:hypothetical protein [Candidatus Methanovirga meridionalis]